MVAVAAAGETGPATEPHVLSLLVDGRRVAPVELADTRSTRRKGLLGRDVIVGALMIRPCRMVHTIAMRCPIDVAHLDRFGTVLRTTTMPVGRLGRPVARARSVIEAGAGAFEQWGLARGTVVTIDGDAPSGRRSRP